MTDDLDTQVVAALHALAQEPASDGRAEVARRISRHRLRSGALFVGAAATVAIVVAVIAANSTSPRHVTVGNDPTSTSRPSSVQQPLPPPLSAKDTGILTFPTTVAEGGDISAVLRNPLSGPNVACFLGVHLERWDGKAWDRISDLWPKDSDPNLAGAGADCAPDLILPGAFIGENTYTIPNDVEPGTYRLVDQSTEGEGRITINGGDADWPRPVSETSIDLSQGASLSNVEEWNTTRAVVLDDNRVAMTWDSECNAPAKRIDVKYEVNRVTLRLYTGTFLVTDCVGEPGQWSTVIDLPAPLWGRPVTYYDQGRDRTAERVDATPISTFVLPETSPGSSSPPIVATSIGRQQLTPVSIQVDVFSGTCIDDAQSEVLRSDTGEYFIQPHVQKAQHGCPVQTGTTRIEPHVELPAGTTLFGPQG